MRTLSEPPHFPCVFTCCTDFRTSPKRWDPLASWNSGLVELLFFAFMNTPSYSVSNSNKLNLFLASSFWRRLSLCFCPEPCVGVPSVWNSCPWGPSFSPEKNLAVSCPGGREGTREEVILDAGGRRWARAKVPHSACSLPPALPPVSCSVPCPCFLLRLANPLRLFPDQSLQGTICSFLGGGD